MLFFISNHQALQVGVYNFMSMEGIAELREEGVLIKETEEWEMEKGKERGGRWRRDWKNKRSKWAFINHQIHAWIHVQQF